MHADTKKVLRLLKTTKGQMDGLIKMVEDNRDCIEISNQILASQSILKKINFEILEGHLNHCVKEALTQGSEKDSEQKIKEMIDVISKLMKT